MRTLNFEILKGFTLLFFTFFGSDPKPFPNPNIATQVLKNVIFHELNVLVCCALMIPHSKFPQKKHIIAA